MLIEFSNLKMSSMTSSQILSLFSEFKISKFLKHSNISKSKGYSPIHILFCFVILILEGYSSLNLGLLSLNIQKMKTPLNDFINNENYNWRSFLFSVAKIFSRLYPPVDIEKSVLIIDDTSKVKTGRKVDAAAWFRDHCKNTYFKGFQNLTIAWSNGKTIIPLDFEMKIGKKRVNKEHSRNYLKGTHIYSRIKSSKKKKSEIVIAMIRRVNQRQFTYKYILWDTWFNNNTTLSFIFSALTKRGKVLVSMLKRGNQKFRYKEKYLSVTELKKYAGKYKRNRKTNIKYSSIIVDLLDTKSDKKISLRSSLGKIKICFFKYPNVKSYRAIITTDIDMTEEEVLQIYIKRWGIECLFKDIKQYLGYSQSQSSKYSALIGDLTIRYAIYIMFCSLKEKSYNAEVDKVKSLGVIFFEFYQELQEVWLEDFVEIMFRKLIKEFLEKAKKLGYDSIEKLIENVDKVLKKFFENNVYIDKIEEVT